MRVLLAILLGVQLGNPSILRAEEMPLMEISKNLEVTQLKEALATTLERETLLRSQLRDTLDIAIRPNTEYLLYQQNLPISEYSRQLQELTPKKMKIAQEIFLMTGEKFFLSTSFGNAPEYGATYSTPVFYGHAPYSGAPLLATNEARTVASAHFFGNDPVVTPLMRALFLSLFATVIFIPALALWEIKSIPHDRKMALIYPLLTIRKMDGHRQFLQIAARHNVK